jgi:hypothetical protein
MNYYVFSDLQEMKLEKRIHTSMCPNISLGCNKCFPKNKTNCILCNKCYPRNNFLNCNQYNKLDQCNNFYQDPYYSNFYSLDSNLFYRGCPKGY